jgi:hypothetical protein
MEGVWFLQLYRHDTKDRSDRETETKAKQTTCMPLEKREAVL